jgi:hypothetical protein
MENFIKLFIAAMLLFILLTLTTPTDTEIKHAYLEHLTGITALNGLLDNYTPITIKNRRIFKEIYDYSGERVGIAIMGGIWL